MKNEIQSIKKDGPGNRSISRKNVYGKKIKIGKVVVKGK
jgi:hypothetical protein